MKCLIGVSSDSETAFWQPVLEGVLSYRNQYQLDWDVTLIGQQVPQSAPPEMWVIIPARDYKDIKTIVNQRTERIVMLSGYSKQDTFLTCELDHHSFGALAARHLVERGHRCLVSVSIRHKERLEQRRIGFTEMGKQLGADVHLLKCAQTGFQQHRSSIG